MGIPMGSREAIETLVVDKVYKRFGRTEWGEEDFDADYNEEWGEIVEIDEDWVDPSELEEEAQARLELATKLTRALTGDSEAAAPAPIVEEAQRLANAKAAQRSRALAAAAPVPAFKGIELIQKGGGLELPAELKKAGYTLVRDDTAIWWTKGRGPAMIKGSRYELTDLAGLVEGATAHLNSAKAGGRKAAAAKPVAVTAPPPPAPAAVEEEAPPAPVGPLATSPLGAMDARAFMQFFGECTIEEIEQALAQAVGDPSVEATVRREVLNGRRIGLLKKGSAAAPAAEEGSADPDLPILTTGPLGKVEFREALERATVTALEEAIKTINGQPGSSTRREILRAKVKALHRRGLDAGEDRGFLMKGSAAEEEAPPAPQPPAGPVVEQLAAGLLRTDGDTQSREELSQEAIHDYFDAMAAAGGWGPFPPMRAVYDGSAYWLYDGFHRLAAFKMYDQTGAGVELPVEVRPGDRRLAVLLSAGVNSDHGVRRTRADKQKAVTKLLRDPEWRQWSDAEIARHALVDPKTVGNIRHKLETNREIPDTTTRLTADGHTVSTPKREVKALRPPVAAPTVTPAKAVYVEDSEGKIPTGDPALEGRGFYLHTRGEGGAALGQRWRFVWPRAGGAALMLGQWVESPELAVEEARAQLKTVEPAPVIEPDPAPDIPGYLLADGWNIRQEPGGGWVYVTPRAKVSEKTFDAPHWAIGAAELAYGLYYLPAEMVEVGYRLQAEGAPLGTSWAYFWTDGDRWTKGTAYTREGVIELAVDHYARSHGGTTTDEEEEAAAVAPPPAAPAAAKPVAAEERSADYYQGFNDGLAFARKPPTLPGAPTTADRVAAARLSLELLSAALGALPTFQQLTGRHSITTPIRRAVEPAMADLRNLLANLGALIDP